MLRENKSRQENIRIILIGETECWLKLLAIALLFITGSKLLLSPPVRITLFPSFYNQILFVLKTIQFVDTILSYRFQLSAVFVETIQASVYPRLFIF